MTELFESGRVADLILLLIAIEAALFCMLALIWRGRVPLAALLLNLAAGACLLLALRAVLTQASWTLAAIWLIAALAAHVGDLILRLRRGRVRPGPEH